MTTYVVIPRQGLGPAIQALSDQPAALAAASAAVARNVLQGTEFQDRPVLTANGLITSLGLIESTGLNASEEARYLGAPRALEGLDVILVDAPGARALAILRDRAEVIPNFEIPIVEPVATEIDNNCSDWHLTKINVQAARKKGLHGTAVRIGILDTGIDATHPEFAGKHINFGEYDTSGFLISTSARDAGDHGTHVCGLAAGKNYGVAPAADLAVAAVLTTKTPQGYSGYLAQILAGLNWLAHSNHGAPGGAISQCPVINGSFGGRGYNAYLYSSLQVIRQTPAAQLIAAIGNNGLSGVNRHGSPGNYDLTLGIGATDSSDIVAKFSDWGVESTTGVLKPDLSAPGVDVCSSIPGGSYARKSGTSMAAPIVAGTAALLIEQNRVLARRPVTLFARLLRLVDATQVTNPANNASGYNRMGAGRLDLTNI